MLLKIVNSERGTDNTMVASIAFQYWVITLIGTQKAHEKTISEFGDKERAVPRINL